MWGRRSILRYALQHAPRLKNESRKRYSAQIGTRSKLGDQVAEDIALIRLHDLSVIVDSSVAIVVGASAACIKEGGVSSWHHRSKPLS